MKYKLSPLNFFSAIVFGALLVTIFVPDPMWGNRLKIYLVATIIVAMAVDYLFQRYMKKHSVTCIIEAVMILLFLILNSMISGISATAPTFRYVKP